MENTYSTIKTKKPFITRKIEKFKQKTLIEKIVYITLTIISLTILFTLLLFILQVARITSIIKMILSLFETLFALCI